MCAHLPAVDAAALLLVLSCFGGQVLAFFRENGVEQGAVVEIRHAPH